MAEREEYFPRGGKKPSVLFKKSANFLGAPEKTERKKKKPKKKSEGDDGYLSDDDTREIDTAAKHCAVGLSYKTIKQGVLVLGRVRQVHETKMTVMLPCRMIGCVMACHISEPYNKILEDYVNDKIEKVCELSQMFKQGQYIALKVLEAEGHSLLLSAMPHHVNGGKLLADIFKGALFQAAVSSVEDHGYVMDIGIPNTRTFLPKKELNPDVELNVGMITWCAVKSVTSSPGQSVVTVSATSGYVENGVLRHKPNTPLLPGTTVEFTVDTPLESGISGHIFGDVACYIQRQHVDKFKGKKPTLGQKIKARVLYVMPTRNTPYLTMKNIFAPVDLDAEQSFQEGDIIEDAQVLKILGRTVHFKLDGRSYGLLSLKRIQVDEDLTDEDIIAKSYPAGSTHKVRVLCYNLSDYVYSVTDEPHVVNERYFRAAQLAPGELVPASVLAVNEKGLELLVGKVKGFVPQSHVTEAGVYVDPKKARVSKLPQKKYKVGQAVTARVLSVDPTKQTLILTLKPSLLDPRLDVLKSYEDAQVGKAYVGVVKLIRDYLLVTFFNNVQAFIPRWFITSDPDQDISASFHPGQIIICTVVNVKPGERKMTGSLVTAPFVPDENRKTKKRKERSEVDAVPQKKPKSDDEDDTDMKSRKKKKHKDAEVEQESDEKPKKKKKKVVIDTDNTELEDTQSIGKKKKKIKERAEETEHTDTQDDSEADAKKKKRKNKSEEKVSEESDAIETDFHDEEILTPHEQGLLDMSDCTTLKDYKKRVSSLLKSIEARERRKGVIGKKIESIEDKGLNPKNKKFHTAMHSERLLIQERTNKLIEALKIAEEKLKELGYVKNENYKEEQKKRKMEKKELKKLNKQKKEKSVENKEEAEEIDSLHDIKVVESLEPALEVPSAKDFWSMNADNLSKPVQEEESSSSEDESAEQPKKKRKKLSVAEKLSKLRSEEDRVRALESAASEAALAPRSVEHFERAALANPGSSQLWIAYMAFHLQATELDKARAVARKALNAIPFREEEEKLNVWLALINLEQRFGTKESQQKTLEDALQMNEPYKVHSKLLDIYVDTGKPQDLSSLADLMLRKYKRTPEAYTLAGAACFKLGLVGKARQIMQKAISVLDKKDHVSVLVQFALLERSLGGRERAEALFEQVLAVYPQRVDVCSVYVDMLLKGGDVEQVRQVMERMTSQKLPARKMKTLYKKWIEVEEKHGDEVQVESIRQRAMEFIEKAKF